MLYLCENKDNSVEKIGQIEIKVKGNKGSLELTPNNYDIKEIGKQNVKTGEIEKNYLRLIDIINYNPSYKEDYIKSLIKKAKKSWSDVKDADEWLENMRGYGA